MEWSQGHPLHCTSPGDEGHPAPGQRHPCPGITAGAQHLTYTPIDPRPAHLIAIGEVGEGLHGILALQPLGIHPFQHQAVVVRGLGPLTQAGMQLRLEKRWGGWEVKVTARVCCIQFLA